MKMVLDGRRNVEQWHEIPGSVRRRFWCLRAGRDVEVVFERRGLPGLRSITGVRSCTAFDPRTAVACDRRCVDRGFRQAWEFPLPVRKHA